MLDNHIDPDAPTLIEDAANHHWDEMNKHGKTVFVSDEEDRVINRNKCLLDVVDDYFGGDLYSAIEGGNRDAIIAMTDSRIEFEMSEALKDYYS